MKVSCEFSHGTLRYRIDISSAEVDVNGDSHRFATDNLEAFAQVLHAARDGAEEVLKGICAVIAEQQEAHDARQR